MNYHHYELNDKQRAEILVRDSHTCQRCGLAKSPTVKLEIHHILPRRKGGTNDPANLITYCVSCHRDEDRDRSKPTCAVTLQLDWADCDFLKPHYIAKQQGLNHYIKQLLDQHLAELRACSL